MRDDRNRNNSGTGSTNLRLVGMLVLAILLVIFTLQNQGKVSIRLFFWSINNIPVPLLIILCLMVGYLIAFLRNLPRLWKPRKKRVPGMAVLPAEEEDAESEGEYEEEEEDEDEDENQKSSGYSSSGSASVKPDPEGIPFDDEEDPRRSNSSFSRRFFREDS